LYTAGNNPEEIQAIKDFFDKNASYKAFKDACFDFKTLLDVDMKGIFACECTLLDKVRRMFLYDNGCNAEKVACNRDATMLENTIIKVDEFHHAKNKGGHKNCSPFCSSACCACLVNVNTSYIEQVNSVLVNARTSAPFFAQDTFIEYLEAIVMFYNIDQQEKNSKRRAAGTMPKMHMAVKQCDAVCISIKHKHAYVQLPHEKPVSVGGEAPIVGVSVADRQMIPNCQARRVLAQLVSSDGADLHDAALYLRKEEYISKCLIPYIQWEEPIEGKVHLRADLKGLVPLLKHFASNACELQNIPALILPSVRKIADGHKITRDEKSTVQMHSPGMKQLLLYEQCLQRTTPASPSLQLVNLLRSCIRTCDRIITAGKAARTQPVDDGWTDYERKFRNATIAPNRPVIWAYPNFAADIELQKRKTGHDGELNTCSKYPTYSKNLMPGLFVVVCVGCGKIELVQMMPSHESPLTAYKAMYMRDWS
jgi:hypothetical protein